MRRMLILLLLTAIGLIAAPVAAQQKPARIALPAAFKARHAEGAGYRILIDEAHRNMHSAEGTYSPLAWLASRDGHLIGRNSAPFTAATLARAQILVIANARPASGAASALAPEEIDALLNWIEGGGSLLLVADHAPFPGHVAQLGERLGVRFLGDALKGAAEDPDLFEAKRGNIPPNEVNCDKSISRIRSFRGSALVGPEGSIPLLLLDKSWQVDGREPPHGAAQAVAFRRGKGRVIVAGEAAMLSAQISDSGGTLMGMGAPLAEGNLPFVLALLEWLGGGKTCGA